MSKYNKPITYTHTQYSMNTSIKTKKKQNQQQQSNQTTTMFHVRGNCVTHFV